jgi:translation initiation factor 1
MMRKKRNVVYSSDEGDLRSKVKSRLPRRQSLPPDVQTAAIRREKKGRGGKEVTVIYDLQLTPDDLKELAKSLKQKCGSGGSVKDGAIEIQGEHRETVAVELERLGYKTKFTGG